MSDQRGFENESKSNTEYHTLVARAGGLELEISMARTGELPLRNWKIESLSACGSDAVTLPTTGDIEYGVTGLPNSANRERI